MIFSFYDQNFEGQIITNWPKPQAKNMLRDPTFVSWATAPVVDPEEDDDPAAYYWQFGTGWTATEDADALTALNVKRAARSPAPPGTAAGGQSTAVTINTDDLPPLEEGKSYRFKARVYYPAGFVGRAVFLLSTLDPAGDTLETFEFAGSDYRATALGDEDCETIKGRVDAAVEGLDVQISVYHEYSDTLTNSTDKPFDWARANLEPHVFPTNMAAGDRTNMFPDDGMIDPDFYSGAPFVLVANATDYPLSTNELGVSYSGSNKTIRSEWFECPPETPIYVKATVNGGGNESASGTLYVERFQAAPSGLPDGLGSTTTTYEVVAHTGSGETSAAVLLPGSVAASERTYRARLKFVSDGASFGNIEIRKAAQLGDVGTVVREDGATAVTDADLLADGDRALLDGLTGDLAALAPLASPAFTGNPTAPTPATSDNDTSVATTAFVKAVVAALVASSPAALDTLNELAAALGNDPSFASTVTSALAAKAPLASPALTGNPTAPTPTAGDNDTSIATTAFVTAALAAFATVAHSWGGLQTYAAGVKVTGGFVDLGPIGTALVISAGAITVTKSYHAVDTEASAATDDLDTINGGTDGCLLYLRSSLATRDTTVKNGTGNIFIGADFTLTTTGDTLALIKVGSNWVGAGFKADNA